MLIRHTESRDMAMKTPPARIKKIGILAGQENTQSTVAGFRWEIKTGKQS